MSKPGDPAYGHVLVCPGCGWYGLGAGWMGGGLPDGLPDGTLPCPEKCGGRLYALASVRVGTYAGGDDAEPAR